MQQDEEGVGVLASLGNMPPSILLALLMQMSGALIWATHLESRVQGIEKQSHQSVTLHEKFARLEERISGMKTELAGVNYQLRVMNEKMHEPNSRQQP